jgi:choice-of-anchor B domain-containing protein
MRFPFPVRTSFFLIAVIALAWAVGMASVAPALAQSGSFGVSVVLDEGELLVGEPNTNFREGSVYVYARSGGEWVQTQRLTAPDAERADGFGSVLARTGNTLFAGQRGGPVHIFEKTGSTWTHTGTLSGNGTKGEDPGCSQYGYCGTDFGIALAAEGDWLLVGAPGPLPSRRTSGDEDVQDPGAVYAYHRGADGQWSERARLQPAGGTAADRFGHVIHLENGRALIAAPWWTNETEGHDVAGRVTEYVLQGETWTERGHLNAPSAAAANLGTSIAQNGNRLYVGAPGWNESQGAVHVFTRANATAAWRGDGMITLDNGQTGDRFGSGIGVTGNELWIGAPTDREYEIGSVYVYALNENGRMAGTPRRIQLENTVERDAFGRNIVADGGTVAVTAPGMHHQSGAVILFSEDAPGGEWLVSPPDALGAILGEKRECEDGQIGPFDCEDVELLAFIPNSILRAPEHSRGVRTNDNWGWTDPETGREYALVGRNDGTSFIDITNPSNPVLIGDLPKPWGTPPSQLWRDIKTYRNYAYIVADGAGDHGMQVFDLTRLRSVTDAPALFEPDLHYRGFGSSHNVIINEESGYAYAVDPRTCGGGLYMMNIEEPLNPVFEGCVKGERGTHDSQCVTYRGPDTRYTGREICLNSNGSVFEIADVTDRANPVHLSTASSPNAAYIHQGWLTDDHRYFYQDDESDVVRGNVETTRTLIWDLTDLEDPVLATQFMGSMPASAHNLYLKDGYAYQANYRYGMHVLDIADPENPVEVGYFDTSPYHEGPGFSGAWSTYPFFESGTVLVTSLQEGLFLLKKKDEAF